MLKTIKMVVGSWGSYNTCNEKSQGSNWLDLSDYDSWEEIEDELINEGFELEGIDEELFVQDLECEFDVPNCDSLHPKRFCETIWDRDILNDENKFNLACGLIEEYGFDKWAEHPSWDDDYIFFSGSKWDYGYEKVMECEQVSSWLENYIDFEGIAQDDLHNGCLLDTTYGLIEYIG